MHSDVNMYTTSVQPVPQFPLRAVWVSPKAKTYLVLHGVKFGLVRVRVLTCVFCSVRDYQLHEASPTITFVSSRTVPLLG